MWYTKRRSGAAVAATATAIAAANMLLANDLECVCVNLLYTVYRVYREVETRICTTIQYTYYIHFTLHYIFRENEKATHTQ